MSRRFNRLILYGACFVLPIFPQAPVQRIAPLIFTPQSPGGSLIAGSNTITLTPVPQGVNGTDTAHKYLVSGGVGTAEACLGTGGSAVSGASTGTLILTCAFSHTGAWTIQSATTGVQEALNTNASVYLSAGSYNWYAPVTFPPSLVTAAASFIGAGTNVTTIVMQDPNSGCIVSQSYYAPTIQGMTFTYPSGATSGVPCIQITTPDGTNTSQLGTIRDVFMNGAGVGIDLKDTMYTSVSNVKMFDLQGPYGIWVRNLLDSDDGDDSIDDVSIAGGGSVVPLAGIYQNSSGGLRITNSKFYLCDYGVWVDMNQTGGGIGTSMLIISNSDFDGQLLGGIRIDNTTAEIFSRVVISDNIIDQFSNMSWNGIWVTTTNASNLPDGAITGNVITGAASRTYPTFAMRGTLFNVPVSGWLVNSNSLVSLDIGISGPSTTGVLAANNSMSDVTTPLFGTGLLAYGSVAAYATLPALADGSSLFCLDCNATCTAGSSTGRTCFHENGAWTH